MSSAFIKTPLLEQAFACARNLSGETSPRFFLKYEFLQPSGSFKSRGIGNLISKKAETIKLGGTKTPHVFASSGGNAGLAAATTCKKLSIPCSVVVPQTTNSRMVERIKNLGADVLIHGRHWKDADTHLRERVMKNLDISRFQAIYAHPFDHELIWEGHSTIVDEILDTLKQQHVSIDKVKGLVCSIGGGGLYNGIMEGLKKHSLEWSIPVIGVETVGCQVLNHSLSKGKQLEFDNVYSIATSIGTNSISKKTFENAVQFGLRSVVLTDAEVIETCLKFADDTNIIPEPACGAALHLAYNPQILHRALKKQLSSEDVIIVIGCGGSASSYSDLLLHSNASRVVKSIS
ncbi:LANO_0G00276g1_1 [Lachancea nothofagi CBS 11611]|uniref:L-serine ammonia-lyase n=1 Tax=Lachancea nothofagi CBS 11611 TaxID=1266666 RepID=A0A1G4KE39_9SACH|nr:LANO_0G00276g1_1 [Lachancea nothofagi CBS 11611]